MILTGDRVAPEKADFSTVLRRPQQSRQQRREVVMPRWPVPVDRKRTCPTCGAMFLRAYTHPKQRFCSKPCADADNEPREIEYVEDEHTGCFVVTSHKLHNTGYPRLRSVPMHRALYEQKFGPIPSGLVVRHKCDNRACINMEHLELGTPEDNWRDMFTRGRNARGECVGSAKLTEEDVREIRASRDRQIDIASRFHIRQGHVTKIKSRQLWRHVR